MMLSCKSCRPSVVAWLCLAALCHAQPAPAPAATLPDALPPVASNSSIVAAAVQTGPVTGNPTQGSSSTAAVASDALVYILTMQLSTSGKDLTVDNRLKLSHRYAMQSLLYKVGAQAVVLSYVATPGSANSFPAMNTTNRMFVVTAANATSQSLGLSAFAEAAPAAYHQIMLGLGFDVQIGLINFSVGQVLASSIPLPALPPPALQTNTTDTMIGLQIAGSAVLPFTETKQNDLLTALLQVLQPTGVVIARITATRTSTNTTSGSSRRLLAGSALPVLDLALQLTSTTNSFLRIALLDPAYARNLTTRLSALGYAVQVQFESPDFGGSPFVPDANASPNTATTASVPSPAAQALGPVYIETKKPVNMAAIVVPIALVSAIGLLLGTFMMHKWRTRVRLDDRVDSDARVKSHTPMMRTLPADVEQPGPFLHAVHDTHPDFEQDYYDASGEHQDHRQSLDRMAHKGDWRTDTGHYSASSLRINTFELPPEERVGHEAAAYDRPTSFSFIGPSINVKAPQSDGSGPQTPSYFSGGSVDFASSVHATTDSAFDTSTESRFVQQAVRRVAHRIEGRARESAEALAGAMSFVIRHLREGAIFKQRYVVGLDRQRSTAHIHVQAYQIEAPRRPVLLKLFASGSDYLSEQSIYDHPYISDGLPGFYDAFKASTVEFEGETCPPCIVLERPVCSLADYLTAAPPKHVEWGDQVGTLFNLCQLVRNLHIRGVVHTDLTPQRFAWFAGEPQGWRLMSFSRWAQAGVHARPNYDLRYAAPEVVQGDLQDVPGCVAHFASDMWALGVIAFELFTGRRLFGDAGDAQVVAMLLGFEALPLEADVGGLADCGMGSEAQALLRGLLRRDVRQRMTMDEVFQAPIFDTLGPMDVGDATSTSKSRLLWSPDFTARLESGLCSVVQDLDDLKEGLSGSEDDN